MITNITAQLVITLLTNAVESAHPSGKEKLIINTVSERTVVTFTNRNRIFSFTNEVYVSEERIRLVQEWKPAPLPADSFYAIPPNPYGNGR